jgi:hypothetical protein
VAAVQAQAAAQGDDEDTDATDLASDSIGSDLGSLAEGEAMDEEYEGEQESAFSAGDQNGIGSDIDDSDHDDAGADEVDQQERREKKKRGRDELTGPEGDDDNGDDNDENGMEAKREEEMQQDDNDATDLANEGAGEQEGSSPKRQRTDGAAELQEAHSAPVQEAHPAPHQVQPAAVPASISDLFNTIPNLADLMQMVLQEKENASAAAAASTAPAETGNQPQQPDEAGFTNVSGPAVVPSCTEAPTVQAVVKPEEQGTSAPAAANPPVPVKTEEKTGTKAHTHRERERERERQLLISRNDLADDELPASLIEQLVTAVADPVIVEIVRSLEKIQVRARHRMGVTRCDPTALNANLHRSSKSKT